MDRAIRRDTISFSRCCVTEGVRRVRLLLRPGLQKGVAKGGEVIVKKGAKTGAKLINQFSTRTIDDAVNYVMKNKSVHIFGKATHGLNPLVSKLEGQENTIRAVLNAANGRLPSSGIFKDVVLNVDGYKLYIRGSVIDGVPKLGTMFTK